MRFVALMIALASFLVAAPVAGAAYYINKPLAEHDLRRVLHDVYYLSNTGVYCRPKKGANEHVAQGGQLLYHKWSCGFVAGEPGASCKGAISIYGSDGG